MSIRHKFITLNNKPVSLARVEKYIELNNIQPCKLDLTSLLDENVLRHWCSFGIMHDGIITYDVLTIRDLANRLSTLDKVDIRKPILMMDNNVIDGVHRILKARLLGKKRILAYVLSTNDYVNIIKHKYQR